MDKNNLILAIGFVGAFLGGVAVGYLYYQNELIDVQGIIEIIEVAHDIQNERKSHELHHIDSQKELFDFLQKNTNKAVVFFHMNGCGWCKKAAPVFEQLAQDSRFADIEFYSVDGRQAQAPIVVSELYNEKISGYPTFFFLDKDALVDKQVGFTGQEIFENKLTSVFNQKKSINTLVAKDKKFVAQQQVSQSNKQLNIPKQGVTTATDKQAAALVQEFLDAADQLPDEKFKGFKQIEDKQVQEQVDKAYNAYKQLYEYKDKFYVTKEEDALIKDATRKLFNLKLVRNMVWHGHLLK
ncbi:MAG: thioredoxin family protein [Candidatus Chromulinivorax sp.]